MKTKWLKILKYSLGVLAGLSASTSVMLIVFVETNFGLVVPEHIGQIIAGVFTVLSGGALAVLKWWNKFFSR